MHLPRIGADLARIEQSGTRQTAQNPRDPQWRACLLSNGVAIAPDLAVALGERLVKTALSPLSCLVSHNRHGWSLWTGDFSQHVAFWQSS